MTSPCRSCVTLVVVEENDSEEAECTVCIDTLKPGQEARSLPCKHTFHRNMDNQFSKADVVFQSLKSWVGVTGFGFSYKHDTVPT